jgi:predicted deacylase
MIMRTEARGLEDRLSGLCQATGLSVVWHAGSYKGTLMGAAIASGIPALTLEVGGMGRLDSTAVATMKKAVLGVLAHLGMIKRHEETASVRKQVEVKGEFMKANTGGMFVPVVSVGDQLEGGQRVGTIYDSFGDAILDIASPHPGVVCAIRTNPPTQPGDQLAFVGHVIVGEAADIAVR